MKLSADALRDLSTLELVSSITELAGHLNAATRRWLALIAEFDRRKGWSHSVTQPRAHWLNRQCGLALGAAREKVRVAHALEELSREELQQARRSASYFVDEDGSLVLKARLPAEAGMLVLKALEAAKSELPLPPEDCEVSFHVGRWRDTDVSAGTSETFQRSNQPKIPPTARRADALAIAVLLRKERRPRSTPAAATREVHCRSRSPGCESALTSPAWCSIAGINRYRPSQTSTRGGGKCETTRMGQSRLNVRVRLLQAGAHG